MPYKDQKKKLEWKAKIEHWLSGGLNGSAWCRENEEKYHKLHYWRNDIYPGYKKTAKDIVTSNLPCRPFYLYDRMTDMRKGFEGLIGLVIENYEEELKSGTLFGFVNNRFNRIKVLYWNDNGLVIWYKRLERGTIVVDKTLFLSEKNGEFVQVI